MKSIKRYFSHYLVPRVLAYAGKAFLKLLLMTCRIQLEGLEEFCKHAKQGNCILMLWHNRLMLVATIFQSYTPQFNYTAFISQSRDGEPLALFANSFKNGRTIRVKHNAKHEALKEMINRLKNSLDIVLITPDGPRGPRYQVKPGLALAAKQTAATVFPFSWSASRLWQLKSWDKMMLPQPFSKICMTIGSPISYPAHINLDHYSHMLENALIDTDQSAYLKFSNRPL
ncbi:Uncharacterized protein DB41_IY00040 [Neochlamydia sp. TUME1]|uniref:lysophospholipid acyltransferase family protein n=1 Tax=Neochlamydia sp. TUME1 TaxID=1478174 RepID=UPI000583ACF5|nr:lysophospholipid acyltransferase family protein [Neochlamydia sp. TUME1]KIC73808.1 Uncharacterized protein DB41_IY00040 [Neochlamydia sp. TUME1]